MKATAEITPASRSAQPAHAAMSTQSASTALTIVDNRPGMVAQRQLAADLATTPRQRESQAVQRQLDASPRQQAVQRHALPASQSAAPVQRALSMKGRGRARRTTGSAAGLQAQVLAATSAPPAARQATIDLLTQSIQAREAAPTGASATLDRGHQHRVNVERQERGRLEVAQASAPPPGYTTPVWPARR